MTTFNIRTGEPKEVIEVVRSTTGGTPDTDRMTMLAPVNDGRSAPVISVDMEPANVEPHRGGTRGTMRGTRRGAF